MLDSERHDTESSNDGPGSKGSSGVSDTPAAAAAPRARATRRRAAKPAAGTAKPAGQQAAAPSVAAADAPASAPAAPEPAAASPAPGNDQAEESTTTRRPARRTRRSASKPAAATAEKDEAGAAAPAAETPAPAGQAPPATAPPATAPLAPVAAPFTGPADPFADAPAAGQAPAPAEPPGIPAATFQPPQVIFQAPAAAPAAPAKAAPAKAAPAEAAPAGPAKEDGAADEQAPSGDGEADGTGRRRRRRGSRSRGRAADGEGAPDTAPAAQASQDAAASAGEPGPAHAEDGGDEPGEEEASGGSRRRRRKRRRGSAADADQTGPDDPPNTVVHVRPARSADDAADEVQVVRGSTRLEAKRQRRREGRDSGRRRPPVITESEFLARREAVDRVMVVRQRGDRTQIAVLEDKVLVEHYVDRGSHQSLVGNVYLGKVQNVLPSMEAAFIDIGKGRNAVLYAGEVNFDASGLEGESKRIESALKSGQSILVQVTKDPIGHKGARLTSQISLPGRYLVYVPGASMTGISRKLPDKERARLKQILKQVMPEGAGVIVRTAAEGASEEELAHDVSRLSAQWESIEAKAKSASAPELLYSEPDLTIRVVRDIFNEDFSKLVVSGDQGWDLVDEYVHYRVDEQLSKALDRKVWLPSGGSLVIDNTEAMTVVDVNTGKFTGQGG